MATNHVFCSYQEVIDLHTEGNHVTVIGVHTPTGDTPRRMFKGLFDQFKQYRYNGCSIKLVPAARLPVDPLNVSVDPGQVLGTKVDPRDALNPLMFHGCHGDDMGTILNKLYGTENLISDSLDGLDAPSSGALLPQEFRNVLERLYYKALTDNSWKKAGSQRGFMKSGLRPLVYSLAANRQIMPGTKGPVFTIGENGEIIQDLGDPMDSWQNESEELAMPVNKSTLQLMTPRLTGLGWIDTKNVLTSEVSLGDVSTLNEGFVAQENYTELPKIFMGVILLPPAYGVEQYFRMIINHSFTFRKFRGISFKPEMPNVPSYFNANEDLFDPEKYDGQDEPDPDPPEPDPPVVTRSVGVMLNILNGSGSSVRCDFYVLGYTTDDGANWTYVYEGSAQPSTLGPKYYVLENIPVGAKIGGTVYYRSTAGQFVAASSDALTLQSSTFFYEGVTYTPNGSNVVPSEDDVSNWGVSFYLGGV